MTEFIKASALETSFLNQRKWACEYCRDCGVVVRTTTPENASPIRHHQDNYPEADVSDPRPYRQLGSAGHYFRFDLCNCVRSQLARLTSGDLMREFLRIAEQAEQLRK
jgi:hypothetical protein